MAEIINEQIRQIDGRINVITQDFSDGSQIEIVKNGDNLRSRKEINPDGSYRTYNAQNQKTEEQTSDGTWRKFNPQTAFLIEEKNADGSIKHFYENGNLSTIRTADGRYYSYYENGNLSVREEDDYAVHLDSTGRCMYEFKNGNLTINPDYYSFYRLGVKTKDNETHWDEKTTLNPRKKTLVCLGGDQTKGPKAANGNINVFAQVLGLSPEQIDKMQLCSCYRPNSEARLHILLNKAGKIAQQIENDYKREILQKFMPFMAKIKDGKQERYSSEELAGNFRNIIIQAHCYGANDLPRFKKVFSETMEQLGYTDKERQNALCQVICITNNSQREFTDNLGFSCIHRYSVKDGQFEPEYEERFSAGYPVFLQGHSDFGAQTGIKSSFVSLRKNEMLMIFDKILTQGIEHNSAFWTTKAANLTVVGKKQADLMKRIGRYWYNNTEDISSISDFVIKAAEGSEAAAFVEKSLADGQKLKREQQNVLKNHHILKSVWNKFNSPDVVPDKTGIYKLLSEKTKVRQPNQIPNAALKNRIIGR